MTQDNCPASLGLTVVGVGGGGEPLGRGPETTTPTDDTGQLPSITGTDSGGGGRGGGELLGKGPETTTPADDTGQLPSITGTDSGGRWVGGRGGGVTLAFHVKQDKGKIILHTFYNSNDKAEHKMCILHCYCC